MTHHFSVSLGEEYMDATVAMSMKWSDPRLRWDPVDFGETRQIRVDPGLIWIPDLEIVNRIHDFSPEDENKFRIVLNKS